jgi:SAM-dependent methyltransferase
MAIDIAPGMVERLSRLHGEITALEMDAEQLKFPDQAFDCVMAGFSIHLVPTPLNAAKEIFRVLKPGGRFGFSIPWGSEDDPTLEFFNSLRKEFLPYADAEQLVDWQPLDAEKVLTDSGFQSIHSIRADVHLPFDTTGTFWRWYLSHGSRNLFDALPLFKQKEFRERVWYMIEGSQEKSLVRGAYFWQGQKQI